MSYGLGARHPWRKGFAAASRSRWGSRLAGGERLLRRAARGDTSGIKTGSRGMINPASHARAAAVTTG
jgi:hypothetical protein